MSAVASDIASQYCSITAPATARVSQANRCFMLWTLEKLMSL